MKSTFSIISEDNPGVLMRIANLICRRGYNIESLSVGRTDVPGLSRFTVIIECPMRSGLWTITNLLTWRIQNMNYLKKKKISNPTRLSKVKKCYWTAAGAAALCLCCVTPAMAAGSDPLDIVNNLSDFIFSIIKALGVIILGWGIVQVGMSIQSHDASQRTQGFLCLFGGLMIAFAKEILTAIGAI